MSSGPDDEDEEDRTKVGQIDSALMAVRSRRDRPHLIVLAGESLGRMFRIDQAETIVGRAVEATIRLEDDGVSRRHAKICQADGEVWVEDMRSANGTIVNGQTVERRVLRDGDKIQMGSTTILKFTYSDRLEEDFQRKMHDAALYDGLTKAYNKRYFLDRLPTEIAYASRHRAPLSLLMFDVDHFKVVNDTHGHLAGDYVLTTLAQLASSTLRTEDLFARYGGEEFAILCRGVGADNAAVLGQRLRGLIQSSTFQHHGARIPVTVSVGVGSLDAHVTDGTQLIAAADAALYEAKRAGRNRVVTYKAG
jgi:two-component system cell cycle response regulator